MRHQQQMIWVFEELTIVLKTMRHQQQMIWVFEELTIALKTMRHQLQMIWVFEELTIALKTRVISCKWYEYLKKAWMVMIDVRRSLDKVVYGMDVKDYKARLTTGRVLCFRML